MTSAVVYQGMWRLVCIVLDFDLLPFSQDITAIMMSFQGHRYDTDFNNGVKAQFDDFMSLVLMLWAGFFRQSFSSPSLH